MVMVPRPPPTFQPAQILKQTIYRRSSSRNSSSSIRSITKVLATAITTPPTRYKSDNARGDRYSTTITYNPPDSPSSQRPRGNSIVETVKLENSPSTTHYSWAPVSADIHRWYCPVNGERTTNSQRILKQYHRDPPPNIVHHFFYWCHTAMNVQDRTHGLGLMCIESERENGTMYPVKEGEENPL